MNTWLVCLISFAVCTLGAFAVGVLLERRYRRGGCLTGIPPAQIIAVWGIPCCLAILPVFNMESIIAAAISVGGCGMVIGGGFARLQSQRAWQRYLAKLGKVCEIKTDFPV